VHQSKYLHINEDISEMDNALDIQGSLKLSLCAGLVQVEGSASYHSKQHKTNKEVGVTLKLKNDYG